VAVSVYSGVGDLKKLHYGSHASNLMFWSNKNGAYVTMKGL